MRSAVARRRSSSSRSARWSSMPSESYTGRPGRVRGIRPCAALRAFSDRASGVMVCVDLRERSAMGENADTMRKAYEDFNSGNMDGVLEAWADDIRWEGSNSEQVPGGGTHDGKDEVAQALGRIPEN